LQDDIDIVVGEFGERLGPVHARTIDEDIERWPGVERPIYCSGIGDVEHECFARNAFGAQSFACFFQFGATACGDRHVSTCTTQGRCRRETDTATAACHERTSPAQPKVGRGRQCDHDCASTG
jgi:hypothetical protein